MNNSRERRYWLASTATLALIFATIPLAGQLSALPESAKALVVVVPTIAVTGYIFQRLVKFGSPLAITAAAAALLLIFFSALRIVTPAERSHIIEYAALAFFVRQALRERELTLPKGRSTAALAILGVTFVGILDELVQLVVPGRVFDWRDIFVDFCAATLGVGVSAASSFVNLRRN